MPINEILTRSNSIQEESNTLGILIIGNEFLSKQLCSSLQKYHKNNQKYKLYLVSCAKIEEVLYHTNTLFVDFVIFLLDTRHKSCAVNVEYNLQRMEKSFLCGRTFIVNATPHIPQSETNVPLIVFIALKKKYNVPILSANIMDPLSCTNLTQRLFTLILKNFGLKLKSPFIPWLFSMEN